jgi:hypothetical protein
MWDLENATPFVAHAGFQRDENARALWCVWIKASFTISLDGQLFCSADQPGLVRGPKRRTQIGIWADYLEDSDIVLPKPGCDIIVHGAAHGPAQGKWERPVTARVALADWEKSVWVWPPAAGAPSDLPCDLGYSEAFGGPDHPFNPIGCGQQGGRLPRLTYPGIAQTDTRQRPASFGVVGAEWPCRAALAGTFDARWEEIRAPLLPTDHDPRARQHAAPDQQIAAPAPGAKILIENISGEGRSGEHLGFALPDLRFDLSARFKNEWHRTPPNLQTVRIDLYARRLSMVWASGFAVPGAHQDVLLDRSYLCLEKGTGFVVAPDLIEAFHSLAGVS